MLISIGGLPGVGKATIARALARQVGAVHLEVDSIEQAIRDSHTAIADSYGLAYRVVYALARDNLRLGRTVITDCVNPLRLTRDAWLAVAKGHCAAIRQWLRSLLMALRRLANHPR